MPKNAAPDFEVQQLALRFAGVNQANFAREFNVPGGASMVSQHVHGNDIEGAKTERVVRILEVHPRLQNFRVWCELRQAERTLSFWGIRQVADAETGELIDFEGWMTEYRRARAAKAKAARDAQL